MDKHIIFRKRTLSINKCLFILFLIVPLQVFAGVAWETPLEPDVRKIMQEAKHNSAEGNYDLALHKYQWFSDTGYYIHYESKKAWLNDVYYEWYLFAEIYSPAWKALISARDKAVEKVKKNDLGFIHFYLISYINRLIGEYDNTVSLFKWLDINNDQLASHIYSRAESTLLFTQEFALCNKYLDSKERMEELNRLVNGILINKESDESKSNRINQFMHRVAITIALLAMHNRDDEAKQIESEALEIVDNEIFRTMITDAYEKKISSNSLNYSL